MPNKQSLPQQVEPLPTAQDVVARMRIAHAAHLPLFFPVSSVVSNDDAATASAPLPTYPVDLGERALQALDWIAKVPEAEDPRREAHAQPRSLNFVGPLVRPAMESFIIRRLTGSTNVSCTLNVLADAMRVLALPALRDDPTGATQQAFEIRFSMARRALGQSRPFEWSDDALAAQHTFMAAVGDVTAEDAVDPEAGEDDSGVAVPKQASATEALGLTHGLGRLAALYALRVVCNALALPGDEGLLHGLRTPIRNAFAEVRRRATPCLRPVASTLEWEVERLLRGREQSPPVVSKLTLDGGRVAWSTACDSLMPGFNPMRFMDPIRHEPLHRWMHSWMHNRAAQSDDWSAELRLWPDDLMEKTLRVALAVRRDLLDPHCAKDLGWFELNEHRARAATNELRGEPKQPPTHAERFVNEIAHYSLRNRHAAPTDDLQRRATLFHRRMLRAYARWLQAIAPPPIHLTPNQKPHAHTNFALTYQGLYV